jgi:ribosomal protein L7Ae-like RNA K-turn-binding protein
VKNDKVLSLIGLATKAGKVASGEFSTEKAVRSHNAFLVIVGTNASDNTKKKFQDMCTYHEVPIHYYSCKEELGAAMGKEIRASIAILDEGFAKAIIKRLGN